MEKIGVTDVGWSGHKSFLFLVTSNFYVNSKGNWNSDETLLILK
jgi:hypothetical protein